MKYKRTFLDLSLLGVLMALLAVPLISGGMVRLSDQGDSPAVLSETDARVVKKEVVKEEASVQNVQDEVPEFKNTVNENFIIFSPVVSPEATESSDSF